MKTLALQQVSSDYARKNARRTLEKPIGLKYVRNHVPPPTLAALEASCKNGAVFVWVGKSERSHQTSTMLSRETFFLFRRGSLIYKNAVMIEKCHSESLAVELWDRDRDGEAWSTIFFFARVADKEAFAPEINEMLKRSQKDHWQGLVAVPIKDSPEVDEFFRKKLEGI